MARRPTQSPMGDDGHHETEAEYHSRIQERMDRDSWEGISTVAAEFPERAIIHDCTPPGEKEPPHIYNWRGKKHGDGH